MTKPRHPRDANAAPVTVPALLVEQQQRIKQQFAEADAERLKRRADEQVQLARRQRQAAQEAATHGQPGIAKQLAILATNAELNAALAVATVADVDRRQKASASATSRAGHRSPMLGRITAAMRPHSRAGTTFKAFMAIWAANHLDGLRLKPDGDLYLIDDENEPDAVLRRPWATIRNWYSAAGKIHDKRRKS